MIFLKKTLLILLLISASNVQANEVKVAVASNFYKPMQQLAKQFSDKTGNEVVVSAGSTGALYAQIKNGAPFDLFLAADQRRPKALEDENHAVKGSRFTYAQGQLAFWSKKTGYNTEQDFIDTIAKVEHIAIANPKNAPYGAAAIDVMNKLGVYQQAQPKIVEGHNISQTYQYVSSETVDCGFVALSQVYLNGKITEGSAWLIPANLHRELKQDVVLLQPGEKNEVAKSLMQFLQSEPAKQIIRSFGYQI
jgi:molybdate transport system substrate-binding protein